MAPEVLRAIILPCAVILPPGVVGLLYQFSVPFPFSTSTFNLCYPPVLPAFTKRGKIPKISGLWYFFHIWKILLLSTLTGHAKCRLFSHQGTHIVLHSNRWKRKKLKHFAWPVEALKSGIWKNLKNVPESWDIGDSGTLFRFEKSRL
jgi:hypothetical protein